jgi:hypothetical protein
MRIERSAIMPPPKLGLRATEKPDTRKKVCCLPPRFPLASQTVVASGVPIGAVDVSRGLPAWHREATLTGLDFAARLRH